MILALGVAWLGVASRRVLGRWWARSRQKAADDGVARRAIPRLRVLAKKFGKLVSTESRETLQTTLRFTTAEAAKGLPRLPSVHLFNELLLLRALAEFEAVYGSMPQDVRAALTPPSRAALNGFRERYVAFLAEYAKLNEELAETLQSQRYIAHHVERPNEIAA